MNTLLRQPKTISLSNGRCRVRIARRGARISRLSGRSGREWLWAPEKAPKPAAPGASYDDHWAGGFEELFPNDAPGRFEGRDLPDHGELWSADWTLTRLAKRSASFRLECRSVPAVVEKTISLPPRGAALRIRYKIRNTSRRPLSHMFKLHPAMRIAKDDRILLPGGEAVAVDAGFSRILRDGKPFAWPLGPARGGGTRDLSLVPGPESRLREFVYVRELPRGWCGIRRASGEEIRLSYPREVFPFCWLFMTFGGWRGHHTVVLEPCTNMPKDLAAAKRRGACATLGPGASRSFSVSVRIRP